MSEVAIPTWGSRQLRRLGDALRDGIDVPHDGPTYYDVIAHYDDLAVSIQECLRALDWESLLVGREAPEITSRAKTISTLQDKLRRDPATPISSVQDIAGVRFEASMTLEEQDIVASAICDAFDQPAERIHDLRAGAHSGYRAVHVWLRLPQGRVEVQIRTHLQGAWANLYEALADLAGRDIRYGTLPADPDLSKVIVELQQLSVEDIASAEQQKMMLSEFRTANLDIRGLPIAEYPDLDSAESALRNMEERLRRTLDSSAKALAARRPRA
ncbi:MAG: hypothetical protein L6311_04165 [Cellulomonas sp.]|nr:hypothetical protein [Cellulomonas sp.]